MVERRPVDGLRVVIAKAHGDFAEAVVSENSAEQVRARIGEFDGGLGR